MELMFSQPTQKEKVAWRNNPHTSSMSDAMKLFAAANRNKPKSRAAKMCQACGAVSIIGSDRLRESNETKHGAFYCDKECAESDRGRVYRTSEAYQKKVDAICQREGKRRNWESTVCKIYDRQCRFCTRQFFANKNIESPLCSSECRKQEAALKSWIAHRKAQKPREVRCTSCAIAFTILTRTNEEQHYCSELCQRRHYRKIRRHTEREKTTRAFRRKLRARRGKVSLRAQFEKFKGVCQLCGCVTEMLKEFAWHQATVDHIVPLSKQGLHVEDNLQLACMACNSKKSDSLADGKQLLLY